MPNRMVSGPRKLGRAAPLWLATLTLAALLAGALRYDSAAGALAGSVAPDSAGWRERVRAFADSNLQHTAWGPAHGQRDYETTLALAKAEGLAVDDDALFAAAYLHDMGGLPPYARPGVDHADRGVQVVDSVLQATGFPMAKAPLVKQIIQYHPYYRPAGGPRLAVLFRDADILDFMGAIGVARILSLTQRERFAPDLPHAVAAVRQNMRIMPAALQSTAAKQEGVRRLQEMKDFLDALSRESDSLHVL